VEYSLSSTLMIVLIGLVTGITDLAALIGIAFANIAMILFGWLMEVSNNGLMHGRDQSPARGERAWWTPFWFGCVAGIGPWLAIGAYLWASIAVLDGQGPPGFVWHPHQPVRAVQHLRAQPVAPVPPGRALARLPVR